VAGIAERVAALIPAAGEGLRLGRGPKALVTLAGETLLSRAVRAFAGCVDEILVAVSPTMLAGLEPPTGVCLVLGGATRQASVYNLLRATDTEIVLVHDAARPFLGRRVIEDVIAAVKMHGAASVVTAVADTLIEAETGRAVERGTLRAVQTPQGFRRDLLLAAHDHALRSRHAATDDAGLVRELGHEVALVAGSSWLMKVTSNADLELAEALAAVWDAPHRNTPC
jgi:2-C-methyl-D-erythritol 4-phosphate cytidylyltransferase